MPGAVARARCLGSSWARIGAALNLTSDTVRRKYGNAVARHARRLAARHPTSPARPAAPPRGVTRDEEPETHTPLTTARAPVADHLAPVLSQLQRASGLSLRRLAERTDVSPGHLSRIMSGERFPSWPTTARLARACGADPAVLHRVWDDAEARRREKDVPHALASGLRYLHRRAGEPSTRTMAITSGNTLDQDEIAAILDGASVPDWETVQRLIHVLDGEPAYFAPLWETAAAQRPTPATPPSPPAPARPASVLEDLLAAFGAALQSDHLPCPSDSAGPLRRPAPAPIPALTRWAHPHPT
ncbi:helix-turn-helix domain-containing protein [Streptomyces celluloflavus]|uniref:helix-turn-helix domain-containing protein n=1 Tax=Streptomyces celluloflavus TaxID=58344 RepID=UPI0037A26458